MLESNKLTTGQRTSAHRKAAAMCSTSQGPMVKPKNKDLIISLPGHWFLHVARFSGGAHSEGELLVGAWRGGHVHGIDLGVVEQLVELGVELRNSVSLGEVLRGVFRPALRWR